MDSARSSTDAVYEKFYKIEDWMEARHLFDVWDEITNKFNEVFGYPIESAIWFAEDHGMMSDNENE